MSFDWEFFGNSINQTAQNFASSIMRQAEQDKERKKAEAFAREGWEFQADEEAKRAGVADYNAEERARVAQGYERDNARLTRDLATKAQIDLEVRERQSNAFLDDADFMADTMRSLASGPAGQMVVQVRMQALSKIGQGIPLQPEEEVSLQGLGPIASNKLAELRQKGKEADLQRRATEEQILTYRSYRDADRHGGKGQLTGDQIYNIGLDVDKAMAEAAAIRATPEYAFAAKKAFKLGINPQTGEATLEQMKDFYEQDFESAQLFFGKNAEVRAIEMRGTWGRRLLSGTDYVPAPAQGLFAPTDAVADPRVTKPVDQDNEKPKKLGSALVSAARGPARLQAKLDVKLRYNLPKGATVHILEPGDTPEHIAAIMKKGDYLFDPDNDQMLSLGWRDGLPTYSLLSPREQRGRPIGQFR